MSRNAHSVQRIIALSRARWAMTHAVTRMPTCRDAKAAMVCTAVVPYGLAITATRSESSDSCTDVTQVSGRSPYCAGSQ
jgi:hypothetical protein